MNKLKDENNKQDNTNDIQDKNKQVKNENNENKIINFIKTNYFYLVIAFIGFLIVYLVNYKRKSGNIQELIFVFNNKCFHIHHWILYSLFILFILLHKYVDYKYLYMLIAFLIGLSSEDLLYSNFLKISQSCKKIKL